MKWIRCGHGQHTQHIVGGECLLASPSDRQRGILTCLEGTCPHVH